MNSVDRFSRDRYAHVTVRAILSKRGITLRSATEPIDDSPAGKLVEGIFSNIAQFENGEKAERTKRGMKAALERGTWPFPVTLGYLKIQQADGRSKIIQDPEVAPLIKQVFELFGTGRYDRVEVLRMISTAGLHSKKGKKLSPQSFCGLLKNPFYAGKLLVKGWEIDAKGGLNQSLRRKLSALFKQYSLAEDRQRSNVGVAIQTFRLDTLLSAARVNVH